MSLEELKTTTEIIQNLVSTIAIIAAGIWSYLVFVVGRSHAVNIKLDLIPQYQFRKGKNHFIVLRIVAENVGKTKAQNKGCYAALEELNFESTSGQYPLRVDAPLNLNNARVYAVFSRHTFLEPNETVSDDAVFLVNPSRSIKVGVYWSDVNVSWSAIHVIEPSTLAKTASMR